MVKQNKPLAVPAPFIFTFIVMGQRFQNKAWLLPSLLLLLSNIGLLQTLLFLLCKSLKKETKRRFRKGFIYSDRPSVASKLVAGVFLGG